MPSSHPSQLVPLMSDEALDPQAVLVLDVHVFVVLRSSPVPECRSERVEPVQLTETVLPRLRSGSRSSACSGSRCPPTRFPCRSSSRMPEGGGCQAQEDHCEEDRLAKVPAHLPALPPCKRV